MRSLRELMDLSGRAALVTGATGHLGAAVSEALAELGAAVAVLDLDAGACASASERLAQGHGTKTLSLAIDLEDEAAVRRVPGEIRRALGRLDVLVHCAALVGSAGLPGWTSAFTEQRSDTWRRALELNLTVPFVLTQACADLLAASGRGSVIFVGSIYGVVGPDLSLYEDTPLGNPAGYAASKGGLLQLTRWLATVMAPAVRVNAVSPGGIERGQPEAFRERYAARTPLGRMAREEDIKGAVSFLASDLSSYVTGQNIMVDGGWTAW